MALAGWLKMIASLYELLEQYEVESVWILVGLVSVLTAGGIFNAHYRIDSRRVVKKETELDSGIERVEE